MWWIVLDTNILISSIIQPRGIPALLIQLALAEKLQAVVSPDMLDEYQRVLQYRRISKYMPVKKSLAVLRELKKVSILVEPDFVLDACPDPDDNRVLECADEAEASFLVTGNIKHFPRVWKQTRIVTPREFWEVF